jgi:hypothetical protein
MACQVFLAFFFGPAACTHLGREILVLAAKVTRFRIEKPGSLRFAVLPKKG